MARPTPPDRARGLRPLLRRRLHPAKRAGQGRGLFFHLGDVSFLSAVPMTPALCTPSVSIMPGLIEFTRIFFGPNSFASDFVTASTAALPFKKITGGLPTAATEPGARS